MKFLMIGAHLDDNEYCGGGVASRLVKQGHEVVFVSLCNGCGGHHLMTPEETVARRASEAAKVAERLGVRYDIWDIDDCTLEADLATRRRLIRYIRAIAPDVIISHRPNDYHADHRAAGQLVQDASYMLIVPHECPDAPAMRKMPVILYYEDVFSNPVFRADIVVGIDDEIDTKFEILSLHESQVYEWLPYTNGEVAPEKKEERFQWLFGNKFTEDTTDEEILGDKDRYGEYYIKTAARFRKELIERYGEQQGRRIRYAEAFEVCEYGEPLTEEIKGLLC